MYGGVGRGPGGDVRRYRHLKTWRRLATYDPHPNPPRTSRPVFFPHVSEGSQCFCFLLRKQGSSSELLASLTPAVLPLTERNKSNACVFFSACACKRREGKEGANQSRTHSCILDAILVYFCLDERVGFLCNCWSLTTVRFLFCWH